MAVDDTELHAAILSGEGREVEFKRGLPSDSKVARSLCAFANTRGGLLLIGVDDDGVVEGAPHPEATARKLTEIAQRRVTPPIQPRIEIVRIEGVKLVVVRVAASRERPHAVRLDDGSEEIVVRAGSSNRVASKATLAALRDARRSRARLDEFERSVVEYVDGFGDHEPEGGASIEQFAKARNVGVQRSKRAFLRLEREGFLVGIGVGSGRRFRTI